MPVALEIFKHVRLSSLVVQGILPGSLSALSYTLETEHQPVLNFYYPFFPKENKSSPFSTNLVMLPPHCPCGLQCSFYAARICDLKAFTETPGVTHHSLPWHIVL